MKKDVKVILGPPGTGKTTRLLDEVDKAIKSGILPERIAYVSFTKKAADEAVSRACEKFGYNKKRFLYFRTLHSIAFRLLKLRTTQIMGVDNYKQISDAINMQFNRQKANDEFDAIDDDSGTGDKCYRVYSLSRARKKSLKDVWLDMDFEMLPFFFVKELTNALEEYKSKFGLYEFSDLLDLCQDSLDIDLFIIDEAQDLTRQQWDFAKTLSKKASRIIIAGDDDQAIYSWAGADVNDFLNIKNAKIEVLKDSYRLTHGVYQLANKIVKNIENRYEKKFVSVNEEDGVVTWINYLEKIDLNKGEWLLLARTKRHLNELRKLAESKGVVYYFNGRWSTNKDSILAALYYENMRKGHAMQYKHVKIIAKFIKGLGNIPNIKNIEWDYLKWPFDGRPDWRVALDGIGNRDRDYIVNLRRNSESLTKKGRVVISTIHGSKGGEADNVLLFVKPDRKINESLMYNADNERRVWYVGVTRSKKNLYLYGDESFLSRL